RQRRSDLDEGVDVVWPPVQEEDRRTRGRAGLDVSDVQRPRVDLLDGSERRVRGLHRRGLVRRLRLGGSRTGERELRGCERRGRGTEKSTAIDGRLGGHWILLEAADQRPDDGPGQRGRRGIA